MRLLDIARVAHEANRAIQIINGDETPRPAFDLLKDYERGMIVQDVLGVLTDTNTPEQAHELWLKYRQQDGWVWGLERDDVAKTHPNIRPYATLPLDQQTRDMLFVTIVQLLRHR